MINQPSESSTPISQTKKIRFTFLRHSQKQSGAVFSTDGTTISQSHLSENGIQRALRVGRDFLTGRKFNKTYHTDVERTKQTLTSALNGAGIESTDPNLVLENGYFTLPTLNADSDTIAQYSKITELHKAEILTKDYPGQSFEQLTPDQQEQVSEYAEEFAMSWYLSLDGVRPSQNTPSPREEAARIAYKINRLINLVDHLGPTKQLDLISIGHKSSTESFLKYILKNNQIDIKSIGGSLKILDSWDLEIENDKNQNPICLLTIIRENGTTFQTEINPNIIAELALEFIIAENLTPKKIDEPKR